MRVQPLPYRMRLRYGDGIAGRAFKTNRLRVYVAPDASATGRDVLDYYTPVPGVGPKHRVMVSLPIHVPEPDDQFTRDPRVYEAKEPYAVLSFGSVRADCPLRNLLVPEYVPALLKFQHNASRLIFQQLTAIVNES
jgi:hypothetical protein